MFKRNNIGIVFDMINNFFIYFGFKFVIFYTYNVVVISHIFACVRNELYIIILDIIQRIFYEIFF